MSRPQILVSLAIALTLSLPVAAEESRASEAVSKDRSVSAKPRGFIEMFVAGVVPSPEGHTLVLVNAEEQVLLPLGIGLTEAISIHTRLERMERAGRRPMTHDLLDSVLSELGGEVVHVQIDDVRDDLFVGTVFIRKAGKVVPFDARPSDAVALAIGSRAPIYVARPVVDKAAIHPGEIEPPPEAATPTPKGILSL